MSRTVIPPAYRLMIISSSLDICPVAVDSNAR
jgi:hypothetical protein